MDERLSIVKDVVFHPSQLLRTIGHNGKSYYKISIVFLIITAIIGSVSEYISQSVENFGGFEIGSIVFFALPYEIILFYIFTLLVSAAGKIFKGRSDFKGLFSSLVYASIPVLVISIPLNVFFFDIATDFNDNAFSSLSLLSLPLIWGLVLSIIAIRESNDFGTAKAIGTIIIVVAIVLIPALIIIGSIAYLTQEDLILNFNNILHNPI